MSMPSMHETQSSIRNTAIKKQVLEIVEIAHFRFRGELFSTFSNMKWLSSLMGQNRGSSFSRQLSTSLASTYLFPISTVFLFFIAWMIYRACPRSQSSLTSSSPEMSLLSAFQIFQCGDLCQIRSPPKQHNIRFLKIFFSTRK